MNPIVAAPIKSLEKNDVEDSSGIIFRKKDFRPINDIKTAINGKAKTETTNNNIEIITLYFAVSKDISTI